MKKQKPNTRELMTTPEDVRDYTDAHEAESLPRSKLEEHSLSDYPGRRRAFQASGPNISRRPHIESLLGGAMAVAMHELNFLLSKVKAGEKLSLEQERQYHKLVDSIGKLTREEREQRKAEGLDQLDREEVMAKLPAALEAMGLSADDIKKLVG